MCFQKKCKAKKNNFKTFNLLDVYLNSEKNYKLLQQFSTLASKFNLKLFVVLFYFYFAIKL